MGMRSRERNSPFFVSMWIWSSQLKRKQKINLPFDITMTRNGDLVYTDVIDTTVNIVKYTQIHTLIKLRHWRPLNICSTSSGDLLVFIKLNGLFHSGPRITHNFGLFIIITDEPIFSKFLIINSCRYISENRNRDICVSDTSLGNVVVINYAGHLRLIYKGFPSSKMKPFHPCGIATDSQSRILIVDNQNNRIHILDQDGQFLR